METTRAPWFTRDYTRRPLTDNEAAFLTTLSSKLTTIAPAQVRPEDTAVTAEGNSCLICLVPHQCLGGLSIVATLAGARADVSWAQVTDLSYHDELDMAFCVATLVTASPGKLLAQRAADSVVEQLQRPILLRAHFAGDDQLRRVECLLRAGEEPLHRVAKFGRASSWVRRLWRSDAIREVEVSFTNPSPPPWSEACDPSKWFARYESSA